MHSLKLYNIQPACNFPQSWPNTQSNLGLTTTAVVHWPPERTYHFLSSGIPIWLAVLLPETNVSWCQFIAWRLKFFKNCVIWLLISSSKYCVWPSDPSLLGIKFKIILIVDPPSLLLQASISISKSILDSVSCLFYLPWPVSELWLAFVGVVKEGDSLLWLVTLHGYWSTKQKIKTSMMTKERKSNGWISDFVFQSLAVSRCSAGPSMVASPCKMTSVLFQQYLLKTL